MATVTIYTTPTCVYCRMAKEFFERHHILYTERNVASDLPARQEMFSKTNQMGVPVIDINGVTVVGFNKPRLAELLGITA